MAMAAMPPGAGHCRPGGFLAQRGLFFIYLLPFKTYHIIYLLPVKTHHTKMITITRSEEKAVLLGLRYRVAQREVLEKLGSVEVATAAGLEV